MPSHVYRFEIEREWTRAGDNVVYVARDPIDGTTVHVCEWPVPADEWTVASGALAEATSELAGVETFSGGTKLYLAAAPERVVAALTALRSRRLFRGPWPGLIDEPDGEEEPSADAAVEPEDWDPNDGETASGGDAGGGESGNPDGVSQERAASRTPAWATALVVVLTIATLGLAAYASSAGAARSAAESRAAQLESRLAASESQLEEKEVQLGTALQERVRRDRALEAERNQLQTALSSSPTRQIWVWNDCRTELNLAVRYLQPNGTWDTVGWWTFPPGRSYYLTKDGRERLRSPLAFYYYAEGGAYRWEGQQEVSYANRALKMRVHSNVDGDGDYNLRLTCGS